MIGDATRRWEIGRDVTGGVLLCSALVLPWNLYFGAGIPERRAAVFTALALATLLCLGSIAVTYVGRWQISGAGFNPALLGRLRLALNIPYLLLVLAFVVFDAIQTVRYGGSDHAPGGVGPGAWLGLAGALLTAQPVLTGDADGGRFGKWMLSARILGCASIAGAALGVAFNLYFPVRYVLPGFDQAAIAIVTTAVVYGAVSWIAVVVASGWILQRGRPSQIATIALGVSTLVAGPLVWSLPIGRDIDAFHGISQNTSQTGVGFEGYLVWAAAAAIFAVPTLHNSVTARPAESAWLAATRKVLFLIVVWCVGSLVMRVTDLVISVGVDLPLRETAVMAAFDLVTAVLAVRLRINLANRAFRPAAIWSMCVLLFGLTISRIVVGVDLAPLLTPSQQATVLANPVYGNAFAQQITSTFDVVLCVLALYSLVTAIVVVRSRDVRNLRAPTA